MTATNEDGGTSRTRVLIVLQFIVIGCLLFYSEEIVEMKRSSSISTLLSSSNKQRSSSLHKNASQTSNQTKTSSLRNAASIINGSGPAPVVLSWNLSDQVCQYQPAADHNNEQCLQLFRSRLPPRGRRWALFGDSTMYRLMYFGKLNTRLNQVNMKQCQCQKKNYVPMQHQHTIWFSKISDLDTS